MFTISLQKIDYDTLQRKLDSADVEIGLLKAKLAEDKPKVLFCNAIAAADGELTLTELNAVLESNGVSIGVNSLCNSLREHGYLSKMNIHKNVPTQEALEKGLLVVREKYVDRRGFVSGVPQTLVTQRGLAYFVNMFIKYATDKPTPTIEIIEKKAAEQRNRNEEEEEDVPANKVRVDEITRNIVDFKKIIMAFSKLTDKPDDRDEVMFPITAIFSEYIENALSDYFPLILQDGDNISVAWYQTALQRGRQLSWSIVNGKLVTNNWEIINFDEFQKIVGDLWKNPMYYSGDVKCKVIEFNAVRSSGTTHKATEQ